MAFVSDDRSERNLTAASKSPAFPLLGPFQFRFAHARSPFAADALKSGATSTMCRPRTKPARTIEPMADRPTGVTLGAEKGYDARGFVNELRVMNVRPCVAKHQWSPLRPRWAHDESCRLRNKPAHS